MITKSFSANTIFVEFLNVFPSPNKESHHSINDNYVSLFLHSTWKYYLFHHSTLKYTRNMYCIEGLGYYSNSRWIPHKTEVANRDHLRTWSELKRSITHSYGRNSCQCYTGHEVFIKSIDWTKKKQQNDQCNHPIYSQSIFLVK